MSVWHCAQMFTSAAEVFRTRQAVRDLNDAVRAHPSAMQRLGTTGAEREAISRIIANGCVLTFPDHARAYSQILLAAAMPEDDFPGFVVATGILIASRLQFGAGEDDLYWNWDAFRDHYRLADPPIRAALMNGFRMMNDTGRVRLSDAPAEAECLTRQSEDVISMLETAGQFELSRSIGDGVSAEDAGRLWQMAASKRLNWQSLSGFRYLYERPSSIDIRQPEMAELIPWV